MLLEKWADKEYLYEFLQANNNDLHDSFFKGLSIHNAIAEITAERKKLIKKLREIVRLPYEQQKKAAKQLFKPLDNKKFDDERKKAKAEVRRPLLRMYAISRGDLILITGGAIKLSAEMDRDHLKNELDKLERAKAYLKEIGAVDETE